MAKTSRLIVLLVGCGSAGVGCSGDTKFGVHHAPPEFDITLPSNTDISVQPGAEVTFAGVSQESVSAFEDQTTTWTFQDGRGVVAAGCEGGFDDDGYSFCTIVVPHLADVGSERTADFTASLTVANDFARDTKSIQVSVLPSEAPSCELYAPASNTAPGSDRLYAEQLIAFEAGCTDPDHDASSLSLQWTIDGEVYALDTDPPAGDGSVFASGELPEGAYPLCIVATDPAGVSSPPACVNLEVSAANSAPACGILLPLDGTVGASGEVVRFVGEVSDPDVEPQRLSVSWESDKLGHLADSTANELGVVTFPTFDLTDDIHVITMFVEDELGESCSDSVEYRVGGGPVVEIVAPQSEDEVDVGEQVALEAFVADDATRAALLDIQWELEPGGSVGSSSVDASGYSGTTYHALEGLDENRYKLRVLVSDEDGNLNSDLIWFNVGDCMATWYRDLDGDGYGDAGDTIQDCVQPTGYLALAGDCDDHNATINPASVESCNGLDDNCNGDVDETFTTVDFYYDADADGYGDDRTVLNACVSPSAIWVDYPGDCDDSSPSIYPGAVEQCNGDDDDCDGTIDDGFSHAWDTPWYRDADGDGHGDGAVYTLGCEVPSGFVAVDDDCDDGDAGVSPSDAELCNGVDDNCDGVTDEPTAIDATTWYADSDMDGFGDPGKSTTACTAPTGFVADATDCDDASRVTAPGATEWCNGVDDNCDGVVDEDSAADAITWYLDGDGDGYGSTTFTDVSCTQPTGYVAASADCNDSAASVSPGATEVCDSVDNDCDGAVDEGVQSTWYLDADGDGFGDSGTGVSACSAPSSAYVTVGGDCNDSVSASFPGATEVCDSVDNDCDGSVDEGVLSTWYFDADGDFYGDSSTSVTACSAPSSAYVSVGGDCNDSSAASHPGAAEVCDTIDNDCDGSTDEGVQSTWYLDGDGDGYGTTSTSYTGCSAPAGYVSSSSDCDDSYGTVYPGAPEVCLDGMANDCSGGTSQDGCTDIEGGLCGLWVNSSYVDCQGHNPASSCPSGYTQVHVEMGVDDIYTCSRTASASECNASSGETCDFGDMMNDSVCGIYDNQSGTGIECAGAYPSASTCPAGYSFYGNYNQGAPSGNGVGVCIATSGGASSASHPVVVDFEHTYWPNGYSHAGGYDAATGACQPGCTRQTPRDSGASSGNGFTACVCN